VTTVPPTCYGDAAISNATIIANPHDNLATVHALQMTDNTLYPRLDSQQKAALTNKYVTTNKRETAGHRIAADTKVCSNTKMPH